MFLMVVACWGGVVLVGTLPFMLSGLMGPVDAFFNSMAGFTTTGAATVTPEVLPPALLLWRSLSQWIGGIGIIVLFVAIAPQAGFGATQLYTAEAATPLQERITPRIRDTVKVLALVYGGLTLGAYSSCTWPGWERSTPSTTPSPPSRPAGSLPTPTPWQPSTPGPSIWRSRWGWCWLARTSPSTI